MIFLPPTTEEGTMKDRLAIRRVKCMTAEQIEDVFSDIIGESFDLDEQIRLIVTANAGMLPA